MAHKSPDGLLAFVMEMPVSGIDNILYGFSMTAKLAVRWVKADALAPFELMGREIDHLEIGDVESAVNHLESLEEVLQLRKRDIWVRSLMETHRRREIYKCIFDDCPSTFKKHKYLVQHLETVHSDARPFVCEVEGCTWEFKTQTALRNHEFAHTDERPHHCRKELCTYSFKTSYALNQHTTLTHSTQRPFRCPLSGCNHHSKRRGDLKKHVEGHSAQYPHACADCHMRYKLRDTLNAHIKYCHSDIREFECDCGEKFKRKGDLKTHKNTVHVDQRKFRCPSCDWSSKYKKDLKRHEATAHSEERPHKCTHPGCEHRSKTLKLLAQHKKTHKTQCFSYSKCGQEFKSDASRQSHEAKPHTQ
ncbi:uncharacterized protein B0I36DRAFT_400036 [Microdochium trichocladiopsis]|uniref:C2H2-type domain-containing protein n=1 Tax=Microdochium trichocladiopsis TaxID=1682393 RepID=A0A9P8XTG2_9PEZI|nr:uncharacterized protein B0I36DRAFT_400036 [Microdochium trichocladiopsis]KAH7012088.1 hypothetical protein B0I36DRAFT_400036 [Microdochium trichocladiopsis]